MIVFYRGGWCPYCNLQLRAWQATPAPNSPRAGATLVAISPQAPDNTLSTAEKNALAFPVLSDSDGAAARAFGVELRAADAAAGALRAVRPCAATW